jgi:autotransporter strand-loop-strand O-heptosyltransferase
MASGLNNEIKVFQKVENIEKIKVNFIIHPFVEIIGKGNDQYLVQFIDKVEKKVVYQAQIKANHWVKSNQTWYTEWLIRISFDEAPVLEFNFNLTGKKVYLRVDSRSLGDNIAWMPYFEEFRKKHNCTIVLSTFFNQLFEKEYPEIIFVKPDTKIENVYWEIMVGVFIKSNKRNKNDYRKIPLQQVATDCLGLNFQELKPKITIPGTKRKILEKYVCIAIHSTANAKYWNYEGGWQQVIDYLNSKGYKVVVINKEEVNLKNIIDRTGNLSLEDRITDLKYSEFFIGLSSGLSWLSWAVGTPVIMISGFSAPWYEFQTGVTRLFNQNVCNSCFNDTDYLFDRGNWYWCPRNNDFICSKEIKPEDVFRAIDQQLTQSSDAIGYVKKTRKNF